MHFTLFNIRISFLNKGIFNNELLSKYSRFYLSKIGKPNNNIKFKLNY